MLFPFILALVSFVSVCSGSDCPDYTKFSAKRDHSPYSTGRFELPFQRPDIDCRTFISPVVEYKLRQIRDIIGDPDLARLFENSFPNTLDTAIKWKGSAEDDDDQELTFIITGDINAMWLRDSANQLKSYVRLLTATDDRHSLASLFRGVINLQARYLTQSVFCNSYQPPMESGITPENNSAGASDKVFPLYDPEFVFECKYELDSFAAFLQISFDYYTATQDIDFFKKFNWITALQTILQAAQSMMIPTYTVNGSVNASPYKFSRQYCDLMNHGYGSPANNGTGLIRSAFRPSDDSTLYQFFIPANMMFSAYLRKAANITASLNQPGLTTQMLTLSANLAAAITQNAIVDHPKYGRIYAFEIDGYGGVNLMDDANIPSLLSAPLSEYLSQTDEVYQNTRRFVLSADNPYYMRGPVISAVGGPHEGLAYAWPMASIVRILTSDDDAEIKGQLGEILASTGGLGLIHEAVKTDNGTDYVRPWFSWANGLFGQMILDLNERKPNLLNTNFQ